MSEIGLEPWNGGLCSGVSGAGRSWKGFAVNDSTAWQATSRPQEAVTSGGMDRVSRGSTIP
jgi:hypothetical protein